MTTILKMQRNNTDCLLCNSVPALICKGLMVGFYGVDRTLEMSTNFLRSFHNNQRRCLVPLPHFKKDLC